MLPVWATCRKIVQDKVGIEDFDLQVKYARRI